MMTTGEKLNKIHRYLIKSCSIISFDELEVYRIDDQTLEVAFIYPELFKKRKKNKNIEPAKTDTLTIYTSANDNEYHEWVIDMVDRIYDHIPKKYTGAELTDIWQQLRERGYEVEEMWIGEHGFAALFNECPGQVGYRDDEDVFVYALGGSLKVHRNTSLSDDALLIKISK